MRSSSRLSEPGARTATGTSAGADAALIGGLSAGGALLGVALAHLVATRTLELAFAALLVLVAGQLVRAERADMLTEALNVYEQCDATADAGRVRHAMAVSGVAPIARARNWNDLTEAEHRVVRLVAAGATNRQAAEKLFLSPHTVSSHLRHSFEKLGIRSGVELARQYAQRGTNLRAVQLNAGF